MLFENWRNGGFFHTFDRTLVREIVKWYSGRSLALNPPEARKKRGVRIFFLK